MVDTLTQEEAASPVPLGAARKPVSDEQMRQALADSNNTNVIRKVLNKYGGQMHEDDLDTCGLHALWKTLQYHDDAFGQKFTTSLYRFVDWECKRELRRQKNARKHTVPLESVGDIACPHRQAEDDLREDVGHIRESMKLLSRQQQVKLEEYFVDQWTMDEIGVLHNLSKEAVRQKLNVGVRTAAYMGGQELAEEYDHVREDCPDSFDIINEKYEVYDAGGVLTRGTVSKPAHERGENQHGSR